MKLTAILPATAGAALLLGLPFGGAAAQQGAETALAGVPDVGGEYRELEDMDVLGLGGEEVGEVEEVLLDPAGRIAVAVEVGGFLGVGERDVLLWLDQMQLVGDDLVTNLTREQIEALPEWEDD